MRLLLVTTIATAALALPGCSAALDFSGTASETDAGAALAADAGSSPGDGNAPDAAFPDPGAQDGGFIASPDGSFPDSGFTVGEDSGPVDPGGGCDLRTHAGCALDQLCCPAGPDQLPRCVATSGETQCAACGQPCTDPAAPYCGVLRRCECAEGTGHACPSGAICLGRGEDARCSACLSDADCAGQPGVSLCGSDFRCRPCMPSDCTGTTPYCATEPGPHVGSCVACRGDADCPRASPICDATSGSCRTRTASDCAQGQVLDPESMTCVACVVDADCEDTPQSPVCTSAKVCGECVVDADCADPEAPLCSPATHTCAACNAVGGSSDARCRAKQPGTHCVEEGARAGSCQVCEGQRPLGQLYDVGCSFERPLCLALDGELPNCHGCDPSAGLLACLLGECSRTEQAYQCVALGTGGGRRGNGRGNR